MRRWMRRERLGDRCRFIEPSVLARGQTLIPWGARATDGHLVPAISRPTSPGLYGDAIPFAHPVSRSYATNALAIALREIADELKAASRRRVSSSFRPEVPAWIAKVIDWNQAA